MTASDTAQRLEAALQEAHLPALIVTLAHLTGDGNLLKEAWRPRYVAYSDSRFGGLSSEAQEEIRALARTLIPRFIGQKPEAFARPSTETLHQMMRFIAGKDIPEHYLPMVEEELGLESPEAKFPHFNTPALRKGADKMKVVVLGGGMSGILAGIKLKEAGIAFEIIERNADIGGTWFENDYPGCRVDSPNHIYSYSFFPNHDWPQHYSQQKILLSYFQDVVRAYGLKPHIRYSTQFETARYDEKDGTWRVEIVGADGKKETLVANAVISALGQLNQPKFPEIKGMKDFGGAQFHSARWRHDVDLTNKNIAVIGTGASAFQIIPIAARQAKKLSIFQRTAPWVSPTPDYHFDVGEGQKWLLKELPYYANWYRFWLFWTITDGVMWALKIDPNWKATDGSISAANQQIRNALVEQTKKQLGDRLDLLDKVIPKSPFGGKRTLRDPGQWIETLKRDNVDLITEGIAEITNDAVVTKDGKKHPADVIIYGTGFHASRFLEPGKIFGVGGVELTEKWGGDPRAYYGMTAPGYPNLFFLFGPNTNLVAQGSIIFFSECSIRYIVGALKLLVENGAKSMEPRQDVHDSYNEKVDAENAQMAWGMEGVTNWYKSETGRVSQSWPFPLVDYWQACRAPEPGDFIFHK